MSKLVSLRVSPAVTERTISGKVDREYRKKRDSEGTVVPLKKGIERPRQTDFGRRSANDNQFRGLELAFKRAFDALAASAGLVALSPVLIVLFLLVRRDGGKAIFAQDRVGLDGKKFRCYKFRTMVPNAEQVLEDVLQQNPEWREQWEKERKLFDDDPRITPLGKFLRKKSLDELPQLINIVKGDMSIVGPRPIVPDEREMYNENIRDYESVRPGLTGAWQVSGRNTVSYEQRVQIDTDYAVNWSMKTDLVILLKTFKVVWSGTGAH